MKIVNFNSAGGLVVWWFGGLDSTKNHGFCRMASCGNLAEKRKCFEGGNVCDLEVIDE